MKRIKNILNYFNAYNKKYGVARYSASISFYMLISLISLLIIVFQIVAFSSGILQTVLFPRIIGILSDSFAEALFNALPSFSLSSFSAVIFISLLWSSSRTINEYNRIADFIYYEIKPRNGIWNRVSAFLMFAMMILVFIFELFIIFIGNFLIKKAAVGGNYILIKTGQFFLELFVIFLTVLILYIYAPPKRMHVKDAVGGALFSTFSLYILLSLFVITMNAFMRFGIGYSVITILSLSLLVLYYGNYIVISGMIVNYFGNFFQLKLSLLRKQ